MARLIADLPKLKAAVDTQDPPTVQPIAERLPAPAGRGPAASSPTATGPCCVGDCDGAARPSAGRSARGLAARHEARAAFWPHPTASSQVVTVPIAVGRDRPESSAPSASGSCSTTRSPRSSRRLTGSEIAFALGRRVAASTLPGGVRDGAGAALRRIARDRARCRSAASEYVVAGRAPLVASPGAADGRRRRGGAGAALAHRAPALPRAIHTRRWRSRR